MPAPGPPFSLPFCLEAFPAMESCLATVGSPEVLGGEEWSRHPSFQISQGNSSSQRPPSLKLRVLSGTLLTNPPYHPLLTWLPPRSATCIQASLAGLLPGTPKQTQEQLRIGHTLTRELTCAL